MVNRDDLLQYVDTLLDCQTFQDYCVNGLQVEGRARVTRIATGVSASMRFFQAALDWGADLLLVHHGLFWKNTPHPFALTGVLRHRVAFLLAQDVNLAAYHLPLDAHPELGNNAQILAYLEAVNLAPIEVGHTGRIDPPRDVPWLMDRLRKASPGPVTHVGGGPELIRTVTVISGGASNLVELVASRGSDAFVTGDLAEQVPRLAEELGIHVFSLGHYNSERLGIMALGHRLQDTFNLPVRFFEVENPA